MKREIGWLSLALAAALLFNTERFLGVNKAESQVLSAETGLTLEQRVANLEKRVASLEKKTGNVSTNINSVPKESFMALPEGSAAGTEWTAVASSEFWLNTSLYGSNVEVSWQGRVESVGGGSVDGWVRVYDLTNHRGVDYSEVAVAGVNGVSFYSKNMAIWRGQNQYRIEVKSKTGEGIKIVSPRLKIIVK